MRNKKAMGVISWVFVCILSISTVAWMIDNPETTKTVIVGVGTKFVNITIVIGKGIFNAGSYLIKEISTNKTYINATNLNVTRW